MADQAVINEMIMKAVAEVTRVMIQTMAETQNQRSENQQGPKLGGPVLKLPQFKWEAADKYMEWKAFFLEVRNVLSTYNTQEQDKIAIVKKLARQERAALYRKPNKGRITGMWPPPRSI